MEAEANQCFVCDKQLESYENNIIKTTLSAFTSSTLFEMLEKLLDESIPNPDQCCCNECTKKLNDYDYASLTALNIEADLLDMYRKKNICYYIEETQDISQDEPESADALATMLIDYVEEDDDKIENEEMVEFLYEIEDNVDEETPPPKKTKRKRTGKKKNDRYIEIDASDGATVDDMKMRREKSLRCKQCNVRFTSYEIKLEHMKTHKHKQLVCDICGVTYKSKTALDVHIGMHSGISPHECDVCGKKFTQKGALVRHMPLHTGEHPYQCDKCGKQFIHYSSFHMHQLAHYDIRLKKCGVCGLELRSNSHLTRHLRVHSGEKPFACSICGQRFAQRYNMTTHYNAHQGIHRVQTKHKCSTCNAAFNKQSKLDEHLIKVHNTAPNKSKTTNQIKRKSQRVMPTKTETNEILEIKNELI